MRDRAIRQFWLMASVALTVVLAGCGRGPDSHQVVLRRADIKTADVVKALGLTLHKFDVVRPQAQPVHVEFRLEVHEPSQPAGPAQTYTFRQWTGPDLHGELLMLLPKLPSDRYYFGIGQSAAVGRLPGDVGLSGAPFYTRVANSIQFRLGDAITLAFAVDSDEVRGLSADDLDDVVRENLRLGKYRRMLVYKARFSS